MLGQVGSDSLPQGFPLGEVPIKHFGLRLHATVPSVGRCVLPLSTAGNMPQELAESLYQRIPQHQLDRTIRLPRGATVPAPKGLA